jgi:glutamate/tyrosine decarboxylase-like PLP-dependent enzyme
MEKMVEEISKSADEFQVMVGNYKVTPVISADAIRRELSKYDFKTPMDLPGLYTDVMEYMKKWTVHVPHPNYFGLFNPATTKASILADTITALFNPQLAAWSHAPAANEIEAHTLDFIRSKIGLPEDNFFGCFTTGGSEANLTATLTALARHFPSSLQYGFSSINRHPVFYLSENAHGSFDKICKNVGIGTGAIRKIPADASWKMNTVVLRDQIEQDIADGYQPFMVVGTAGTTSAGVIDPLPELKAICKAYNLWFHVDAAWGGAATFSKKLKPFLDGIQQADSVTIDAHKWFSVPLGAGMFFTNHKRNVEQAFTIGADYMPQKSTGSDDPYLTTIQWSRRFIGLKLFMTFAERGESGIETMIDNFSDLGDYFRKRLISRNWRICNNTPLPVICFTHPYIRDHNISVTDILNQMYNRGQYWISSITTKSGEKVFRACITSFHTTRNHIDGLLKELNTLANIPVQSK